jgi:hypothetical protein
LASTSAGGVPPRSASAYPASATSSTSRSPPLSPPRGVEWVIWQIVVRCLETHLPADELAVLRQGKRVRHATRYHRHRTSRSAAMPRRGRRAPAPTTHPRRRIRDACVMPVNGYRSSKIAQVSENTAIMARMAASRTSPASASTRGLLSLCRLLRYAAVLQDFVAVACNIQ